MSDDLDAVWKALANPVRRHMLDLLRERPRTTGELAEAAPDLSRFAVMQHLAVLTEADLVVSRRDGRRRVNYLNPVPIQQVYERWVRQYEGAWAGALTGLKRAIEQEEQGQRRRERRGLASRD